MYDKQDWDTHLEWLLGRDVYGLKAADGVGNFTFAVPWLILLKFEQALREKAMEYLNSHMESPLREALEYARNHERTKLKYFERPLAISAGIAAAQSESKRHKPNPVFQRKGDEPHWNPGSSSSPNQDASAGTWDQASVRQKRKQSYWWLEGRSFSGFRRKAQVQQLQSSCRLPGC